MDFVVPRNMVLNFHTHFSSDTDCSTVQKVWSRIVQIEVQLWMQSIPTFRRCPLVPRCVGGKKSKKSVSCQCGYNHLSALQVHTHTHTHTHIAHTHTHTHIAHTHKHTHIHTHTQTQTHTCTHCRSVPVSHKGP